VKEIAVGQSKLPATPILRLPTLVDFMKSQVNSEVIEA
jgi:hypothetical protein